MQGSSFQNAAHAVHNTHSAPSDLGPDRHRFYQTHLDRVSRSFAYGIRRLEAPLRGPVGLSYLICRLLDTVEDAPWASQDEQVAAFLQFDSFMEREPMPEAVRAWANSLPQGLPEGEVSLLADAFEIFSDFHHSPVAVRDAIRGPVLSMSGGMRFFMSRSQRPGELRLKSLVEVDRYCFFVAGVVGEILTGLLRVHAGNLGTASEEIEAISLLDGCHFGLFLQKVNLLKDQGDDVLVGRHLVPSRPELWASLRFEADSALRYLLSIPVQFSSYRLFCAWALYLGLASLPWLRRAEREGRRLKISRLDALALGAKVEKHIKDNFALQRLYDDLQERLDHELGKGAEAPLSSLMPSPTSSLTSGEGDGGHAAFESTGSSSDSEEFPPDDSETESGTETETETLLGLYQGRIPRQELEKLFQGNRYRVT